MEKTPFRIKESRKKAGLTMQQLAEKMEVSRATITKWENGSTNPKRASFQKLANVLGVDEGYLLGTQQVPQLEAITSFSEWADSGERTYYDRDRKILYFENKKDELWELFKELDETDKFEVIDYIKFKLERNKKSRQT